MTSVRQDADAGAGNGAGPGEYHYRLIYRAIRILDASPQPMSLEALSTRLGLSVAHFQRTFSRWAGVSPKRYQQYLMLEQARRLLAARFSLLETCLAVGASGPGRMHDLFLRWEAMTRGAYARAGAGMVIRHGWTETPFGPALGMATEHGLCALGFAQARGDAGIFTDLAARWPRARHVEDAAAVVPLVSRAVAQGAPDGRAGAGVALHVMGAPFQIKVWEALLHIPEGQVTTYGTIARAVGTPGAARAVGNAVGANPLALLIPCHRVLRASGAIGGYRWGEDIKRAMLAREAARTDAGASAPLDQSAEM